MLFFVLQVTNTQDEINYCLVHAIEIITQDKDIMKHCKLMYAYDEVYICSLIFSLIEYRNLFQTIPHYPSDAVYVPTFPVISPA